MFTQLADAMNYIHNQNIAHRDIKLDNILYDDHTNTLKLIDFGFAAICSGQKLKIFCGTPSYMAPEIV
jgi:serine/threonine protein kinase